MLVAPIAAAPTQVTDLVPVRPAVAPVAAVAAAPREPAASASQNLSQTAYPTYQALQSVTAIPPSSDPTFVPPPNGNALRLYAAVQAIAAERVYPAPIFSFSV
ncbi:MAG: hypothetical protein WCC70_04755 [Candidatus Aquilonibacter sp.]|jgi:hypothetical protein